MPPSFSSFKRGHLLEHSFLEHFCQRRRNDNIDKIAFGLGVGEGTFYGKWSQNAVFFPGKFHDNRTLEILPKILLSEVLLSFGRLLFSLDRFSVIQGIFYMRRFSNISFGRTLLGSILGASCLNKFLVGTLRPSPSGKPRFGHPPPPLYLLSKEPWWTFRIFFIFSARGRERGPRRQKGDQGGGFFY